MSERGRGRGARGGSRGNDGGGDRGDFGGRGNFGNFRGGDRGSRGRGGGGGYGGGRGGGGGASVGIRFDNRETPSVYHADNIPEPDAHITQVENTIERALTVPSMNDLSLKQRQPARPGYGTKGMPVTLWANYLELTPNPKTILYRYSIVITPEVKARKLRRVIEVLLSDGKISRLGSSVASDFSLHLITSEVLAEDMLRDKIKYRLELEDEPLENAQEYSITLDQTGTFSIGDMIDYMTSTQASAMFDAKDDFTQAMNIVFGYTPKADMNVLSIGANRHYRLSGTGNATPSYTDLGGAIYAWRGFFMSVRMATSRLLLNVQPKSAALIEHKPLIAVIGDFATENGRNTNKLNAFLSKVKVETNHLPIKKNKAGQVIPRIKTIIGLATTRDGGDMPREQRPIVSRNGASSYDVKFFSSNEQGGGQMITVAAYFKQKYGLICQAELPVLNVGTRGKPTYLPADVCSVKMGQVANSKLSGNQTTAMLNFAALRPHQNAQLITQYGIDSLALTGGNPTLSRFLLSLASREMITVPGRVLAGPNVLYRQDKLARTKDGSWNMKDIKFSKSGRKNIRWTAIWLDNGGRPAWQNFGHLKSTVMAFYDALKVNGVDIESPFFLNADSDRPLNVMRVIEDSRERRMEVDKLAVENMISRCKSGKADIILVVLTKQDVPTYNAVKRAGDVLHGVSTVCVIGDKFAQAKPQTFANIALKFNLKLGGDNQRLEPKKLGIVGEGKTMVVGLDVTHPSPGSADTAPSIAGIVASIDMYLSQFPAQLSIQERRKEMITDVGNMLKSRLTLWQKHNKQLPENILVYRDGVSEGEYELVRDLEVPALKKACSEVYPADLTKKDLPRITFIIVGKRHHTRFYPTTDNPNLTDTKSGNPKNGTCVDRGVDEARIWDWFCQSHTGLQGTARPAHYVVVSDEIFRGRPITGSGNTADVLEDLTHNMCYLFGRATKAVSRCPPAYYADLVCARARSYLSHLFDPSHEDAETTVSGASGRAPNFSAVDIHADVKDVMFYI